MHKSKTDDWWKRVLQIYQLYQQAQPFFFVFPSSSAALFACRVSLVFDLAFFFFSASSRFERHYIYSLTIWSILSLNVLYSTFEAVMNNCSIFSPVSAEVSKLNWIPRSALNFSMRSSVTARLLTSSFLLPTRNRMTSGSLYAITSLYQVARLLNVSKRVISYVKKMQCAPR